MGRGTIKQILGMREFVSEFVMLYSQVERKDSGRRHSSRRGNEHANHSAGDGPKPIRAEWTREQNEISACE